MYYSIRGKVTCLESKSLIVETSNGIGYEILVAKPETFLVGEEINLYLHHEIKEDDEYLAGFRTQEEKEAFRLLLHVNGIGPKSALTILNKTDYDSLLTAISNNDLEFIENIPGISSRVANQIFLDLKEFIAKSNRDNVTQYKEVKQILKALNYKVKEIDKVLPNIFIPNATNEEIVKEALRRLAYAKNLG